MQATDVNARRKVEMSCFFEELEGRFPDVAVRSLTEVFHLA